MRAVQQERTVIATTDIPWPSTNRLGRALIIALAALPLPGCGEAPGAPAGAPSSTTVSMQALAIDSSGVAGARLPSPLRVIVRSERGVIPGAQVMWSTSSGRIEPSVSTTDARGIAIASWTLGVDVGAAEAHARVAHAGMSSSITLRSTVFEPVSVVVITETNNQRAAAGATLKNRLQLRVTRDGGPKVGALVQWSATAGSIGLTSFTDSNGVAETEWRMPDDAGSHMAYGTVAGARDGRAVFVATSFGADVERLQLVNAATRSLPANVFARETLRVIALDALGGRLRWIPVVWTVPAGLLRVVSATVTTDQHGEATAIVAPIGNPGSGTVALDAEAESGRFQFTLTPRFLEILLITEGNYDFQSSQNGTKPALDTAYVGETVVWRLFPFDYDEHYLSIEGVPALPGNGLFPYARPSEVRWVFTKPGRYPYRDTQYGGSGAILVLPDR